jgi:hypothetical protein
VGRGGADYGRLTAALSARAEPVVTMSWQELDEIVGGLSRSAVDHFPQWWHGDRPNTRTWRRAGYELVKAEPGRLVVFRRAALPARASVLASRRGHLGRPRAGHGCVAPGWPVSIRPGCFWW